MSSCEFMLCRRCSSLRFSCFSRMNSRDLSSRALSAATLSASARRRSSSSCSSRRLSTICCDLDSSSIRSFLISCSYLRSSPRWSRSSLTRAWFLMFLARLANLSVDSDSGKASSAGEIMAIIVVLQLPPRLSSSMRVSFESRYGMCILPRASVSAAITLPSADSDWLIFLLSSRRRPVAPVSRTRSDPARSTRLSLPTLKA
mmetsp:Transcript_62364/g.167307  ORF Transcript_62364/g.167307 Transcript_62364/m.167307 type:complete len:202 (+) Transcript_62364:376-981(+)